MAAPSTAFLCQLESHFAGTSDSDRWIISAAATSTALGYGQHWLPAIYHYACRNLRASPADSKPAPMIFANDTLPRRRLARKLKDVLMKSMLLAGVSRCIEASIALGDAVDPVDRAGDTGNYRSSLSIGDNASADRGKKGLLRVYRHQLGPISDRLSETGPEMNWLATHITYGHFLEPCSDTNESAPLTFPETEIVVLSCLIAQRSPRQLSWHLRGALRSGLLCDDIEVCQKAVEMIGRECGERDLSEGMPRVQDVTDVDELS